MTNEFIFLGQAAVVCLFALWAVRLGKEALSAWIALQAILANLFVLKQISFLGFNITCSDVFAIGSILGMNLLREYWGGEAAKKTLSICFFSLTFFALMSQIHLFYHPNAFDTSQGAFAAILSPAPRLLLASIGVFLFVQQIDLRVFGYIRERWTWLSFPLRNAITLVSSQLIDTVLFSIFGLWGLVSELADVIIISFALKVLVILLLTPITLFAKRCRVE